MPRLRSIRASFGALTLLLGLTGCDLLTAPTKVTRQDVELFELIPSLVSPHDGFFRVLATPSWDFEVRDDEQLVVTVETSRGDRELLTLEPHSCFAPQGRFSQLVGCNEMVIELESGATIDHLRIQAEQTGVRLRTVAGRPDLLLGRAFGNWGLGFTSVGRLGGVKDVRYNTESDFFRDTCLDIITHQVAGGIPAREGRVTRDDGELSIAAGDVVTTTYSQPGGSVLSVTRVVQ